MKTFLEAIAIFLSAVLAVLFLAMGFGSCNPARADPLRRPLTWVTPIPDPLTLGGLDAGVVTADQLAVRGNAGVDGGVIVNGSISVTGFATFSDVNATGTITAQDQSSWCFTAAGSLDVGGGANLACIPGRYNGSCLQVAGDVALTGNVGVIYTCAVAPGLAVYLSSGTEVAAADAADATRPAEGVVASNPTASTCLVVSLGTVSGLAGLTPGARYYLGTAGALTATPPSGAGNIVQMVGRAIDATTLRVSPQLMVQLP